MLKRLLLSCLFLLATLAGYSQYKISGIIADTANLTNLSYSSVSIMKASDSVLQDFTRSDGDGNFELKVPEKGNYFIRVSNPALTTFVTDITVQNDQTLLDTLHLISLQNLLDEVIVKESRSITIKGDTVEYNADSFKVGAFATVDELLRKLPGIEMSSDGKIKAHGQNVNKMLVDGDEFFSDDPAVVAKMLQADIIDKVQVFDTKSEAARLSGIPDDTKEKTINLTLKESAKQGIMGNAEAGYGTDDFYEGKLMLNSYKKKRKVAAFVIGSNTDNQGLGWEDNRTYGNGGGGMEINDGDGTAVYFEGGNGGSYSGQGLPKSVSGGLTFSNKFGKDDALSVTGNYNFKDFRSFTENQSRRQYFMPDTQYVNDAQTTVNNRTIEHGANTRLSYNIDSSNTITLRLNGSVSNSETENHGSSSYSNMLQQRINESSNSQVSTRNRIQLGMDLNYYRNFKKKGRNFNTNIKANLSNGQGATDFVSENRFNTTNTETNYNQLKRDTSSNSNVSIRASYTEPLINEKLHLISFVGASWAKDLNVLRTYDRQGAAQTQNDLYSSDVNNTVSTSSIGSRLRFNNKVWNANLGGTVQFTDYQNTNNFNGVQFQKNYLNFFPSASIRYSKSRSSSLSLNYNGRSRQPQMNQIQVMVQNTDPLNIRIGNQNLTQEFTHSISSSFNTYKMLSERYTYGQVNYNYVDNAFGESQTIDANGVNTRQTVNVNGNWNADAWLGMGLKLSEIDTRLNLSANVNYGNRNNILNGQINSSKNLNFAITVGLNYYQDTGFRVNLDVTPSYNLNKTEVSFNAKNKYWMSNQNLGLAYVFGTGLEIGTNIMWRLREKMDDNDQNNNVLLANPYISKTLLKDKSLKITLKANDIFNQNIGFQRQNYANFVSETQYNNIRRYYMITSAWRFTHNKGVKNKAIESNSQLGDLIQ